MGEHRLNVSEIRALRIMFRPGRGDVYVWRLEKTA
jgi:hypothetical protein